MISYLNVDDAYILPEFRVVYKITLPLPHPTQQLIKARAIIQLVKKVHEEVYISRGVDKMSTGALKLWFPHLQSHRLREYLLRKLVLGTHSCGNVLMVVVNNVGSLGKCQLSITRRIREMVIPLRQYGDASWTCPHFSGSLGLLGCRAARTLDCLPEVEPSAPTGSPRESCYPQWAKYG